MDQTKAALAAMGMASALIAVTSLLAKGLGLSGLHPFQVSAGRFVFALLALLAVIVLVPRLRPEFRGVHWRWHIIRSLLGWLGATCMFGAAAQMPLAEATALSMLSPLVAMLLALLMLGERASWHKAIATVMALTGAVVILRPGAEAFHLAAVMGIGSALFLGLEAIYIKRLAMVEPPLQILIVNNGIGSILAVSIVGFVWVWPQAGQWQGLFALGVVMVSAQAFYLMAMRLGEASLVMPVFYLTLVFAGIYDFVLYGVMPSWMSMLGAGLIVASALSLAGKWGRQER